MARNLTLQELSFKEKSLGAIGGGMFFSLSGKNKEELRAFTSHLQQQKENSHPLMAGSSLWQDSGEGFML